MDKRFLTNFLKGSASASLGSGVTVLFHFLSIMIMTRGIPKDDFGLYILILATMHCFVIFGGMGLDLTLVRMISSENKDEKQTVLIPVLALRAAQLFIVCIIFFVIGSMFLPHFDARIKEYLVYIPAMFCLASFRELFFYLLQGMKLFKQYAGVQVASAVIKCATILTLLLLDSLSLSSLLLVEIIMLVSSLAIQIYVIPFKSLEQVWPSVEAYRKVLRFSFPLYLNNILTFVYDRMNVFLIGGFLNPASIAIYSVSGKIPEGFFRLFKSFIVVYFPNLSSLFSKGRRREAQDVMNQSLILFSIAILFFVMASFLFRDEIITLIFSSEYLDASFAFSLMMLGLYLRVISNIMGYSLVSAGHPSTPVKVNSVSSIINLLASLAMIPAFGFIGAVYSLLIMNIISQVSYSLYLMKFGIAVRSWGYLKPAAFMFLLVSLQILFGLDGLISKSVLLLGYLVICWVYIKEFQRGFGFILKNARGIAWQAKSA